MRKSLSFRSCVATIGLLFSSSCVSWEVPDVDGDGVLVADGDCNDLNADSFPGAVEVWYDGEDQDCDGNDGDQDGDGWLERAWAAGRTIPVKHRTLEETLNPQPEMATVMEGFMEWVDRENANLHAGLPSHPFETPSGEPIFPDPESGSEWFLTDAQQRLKPEVRQRRATNAGNDDDGPDSDEDDAAQEEDDCEASHGSSGDSDTSGVTDLDDDKSDDPDELAPRECNSFSHAARRHEGAPLSFWNELGGDNLPFRDSGEDSAKSPSAPQQAPEPQAVNTAAGAADRPSRAAKRRAVATDVPEESYVVHVDSVAALPNELRRRAKAGIGIDVKQ